MRSSLSLLGCIESYGWSARVMELQITSSSDGGVMFDARLHADVIEASVS